MERVVLHSDLNNFFASVECNKFPQLTGYPVAVCGDAEARHGIILAKNEIAKKFGVKTAETIWEAKKKCPKLVTLPPHMDEYVEISRRVQEIYMKYTDLIEPFGIDECWLDVTGSRLLYGNGEEIAYKIKDEIKQTLNLTASIGVSFNKIYAKLGSDLKKPDAVTVISRENYKQKLFDLNANEMIGIGKKTYEILLRYGIKTIGDLASTDDAFLTRTLGKSGPILAKYAKGDDDSPVMRYDYKEPAKSIGNSHTSSHDLTDIAEIRKLLFTLSDEVAERLYRHNFLACGIQITVKYNDFTVREVQSPLPFPTRDLQKIAGLAVDLFTKNTLKNAPVRLLGVRAYNLISDKEAMQCNFFENQEQTEKQAKLEKEIYELRKRFGSKSVVSATLIENDEKKEE